MRMTSLLPVVVMKMSALVDLVLQQRHLVAVHRRLKRADRVDLGHLHPRTRSAQRRRRAFAHVAIAADNRDLARHHRVRRAPDAVDQRFLAPVLVVELRLGDAVVDVERRERQVPLLHHLVETMNARRRLFRHPLDHVPLLDEPARALLRPFADLSEQRLFLLARRNGDDVLLALFDARAHQDVQRRIAPVVEDHVRAAFGELEDHVGVGPVIDQRFALDREDRRPALGDRRSGVVLGREDVARRPAHVGAQRLQRLDQNGGLDRHVQRSGDARALQRLACPVFLAQRHEARHLGLGDFDFLAAIPGQRDVLDDVILGHDPLRSGSRVI